jgi:hypothetical protein
MRIYPTHIAAYDRCRRAYWFAYLLRIRSAVQSANLVFGRIVHEIVAAFVRAHAAGSSYDAVPTFERAWRKATNEQEISYSASWSNEALLATGRRLVELFTGLWPTLDLRPLVDDQDEPVIERKLVMPIAPGLELGAILDFAGINDGGEIVVIDFKTPGKEADSDFPLVDDQTMAQQLLLEHHAERLGIERADRTGFMELVKRKLPTRRDAIGPTVERPILVPRRGEEHAREFRQKLLWMADAIGRGIFPRDPGAAFESPCGLCDFKRLCYFGDVADLQIPPEAHGQLRLAA